MPKKPALADQNSKEGLQAFAQHWFELFSYGYATNDWTAFGAVTDKGCDTCQNVTAEVQKHYDTGGWIQGGEITISDFSTKFQPNQNGSINSFVEVQQSELIYRDQSGREAGRSPALKPSVNVIVAQHDGNGWRMLDFGTPEGG